jgi:hypothetical protein
LGLAAISGLGLSGCGENASAAADDPVAVAQAYMKAVEGGNKDGGQPYLETQSDEKLTGDTPASRYMADHKGANWEVVAVPWVDPGTIGSPKLSKKACLIGKPAPSQICLVTLKVTAGSETAYFQFSVENRYGPYQIIAVDRVTDPVQALPQGNEAHLET